MFVCLCTQELKNQQKNCISDVLPNSLPNSIRKMQTMKNIQDNENRETEPCVYNRLSPNLNKSRTSVEMAISERCKVVQRFHIRPHIAMQHLKKNWLAQAGFRMKHQQHMNDITSLINNF
jgi:hypothetical protein